MRARSAIVSACVCAALWLALLASAANAQSKTPPLSRAQVRALANGTQVQPSALALYVDPTGNDGNACTATGTAACATPNGAALLIPRRLRAAVTVTHAAGTYAAGAIADNFSCEAGGSLILQGTLATVTPTSGAATGTATSGTAGSAATRGTLTKTAAGWTVNDFQGKFLSITGGTGSGQLMEIESNTASVITVEGVFATAPDNTSTYAVQAPASTIHGNVASYTWQSGPVAVGGPSAISAGFFVSGDASVAQPPCVTLRYFAFDSSVSRGIVVAGGAVDISYNTFTALSSNPISISGQSRWDVHHNTFASASRRGVLAFADTSSPASYLHNNVMTAGNVLLQANGPVQGFQQWNYVSGATGAAVVLSGPVNWVVQYDVWTAFGAGSPNCIAAVAAGSTGINTGQNLGAISVDATVCNSPGSTFFSVTGPMVLSVDQALGVASTGTNTGAVRLYDLNQGAKAVWASTTAFTASGGASDIKLDSDVTAGVAVTLAALQANVPKSAGVIGSSTFALETGGATTTATPPRLAGNTMAFANTALPTCSATTLHEQRWDSTGETGGKASKPCECELAADGTTYRWRNRFSTGAAAIGNTTTCPDTIAAGSTGEFPFSAYDGFGLTATGTFAKMGPTAKATTIDGCDWVQGLPGVGGTTQTIKLCSDAACAATTFATWTPTCTSAAGTAVSCTINTAAVPAGTTLYYYVASTTCTTDSTGNVAAHFKE